MEELILTEERKELIRTWFRDGFFPPVKTEFGNYDSGQVQNMLNHILKFTVGTKYSEGTQMLLVQLREEYVRRKSKR